MKDGKHKSKEKKCVNTNTINPKRNKIKQGTKAESIKTAIMKGVK